MKQKSLKNLNFKKTTISKLKQQQVQGGRAELLKTGQSENYCTRGCSAGVCTSNPI